MSPFQLLTTFLLWALTSTIDPQCATDSLSCSPPTAPPRPERDVSTEFLFSTPLLRLHISSFVPNATAFNAALTSHILADYADFLSHRDTPPTPNEDPALRNDNFFWYQTPDDQSQTAEQMQAVDARAAAMRYRRSPQFRRLTQVVRSLAKHAARYVLRVEEEVQEEGIEEGMHPWAAVHYERGSHGMHFHEGSALAAVYYVSVPEGAGELTLYDPRGPRPPFEEGYTFLPKEGELVMFPGWLGHSVGATGDTGGVPRISIPFNSGGNWEMSGFAQGVDYVVDAAQLGLEEEVGVGEKIGEDAGRLEVEEIKTWMGKDAADVGIVGRGRSAV